MAPVRRLAFGPLLCACVVARAAPEPADARAPIPLAVAPGDDAVAGAVRAALGRALSARGRTLAVASAATEEEPSLRPALAEALAAYEALRFEDALRLLEGVAQRAGRLGGGDLDARALGDLSLHVALCAFELGRGDVAWDALVKMVRVDPGRTLDPARTPPRALTAHRRAQAELAQLAPVELELQLPRGGRARIDGDDAHESGPLGRRLAPGPHYVRVDAPGYAPLRGIVSFAAPGGAYAPSLQPRGGASAAGDGADLERVPEGWRLTLRHGDARERVIASALVGASDAAGVSERLVARVLGAPPAPRVPVWKRWWIWVPVGAAAAAVAIAVPVALTRGGGLRPGSVGGTLEPVR